MVRIIFFLVLIAIAAAGATWIADQSGDVVMSWGGWRAETTMPVFVLIVGLIVAAVMLTWVLVRETWRLPIRIRRKRRERRLAKGRDAITKGLLAIGQGDSHAARRQADLAHKFVRNDPLALLLAAQSAQLDGDREGAHRAFSAMAERSDTRLLGLRGLFIEAQRRDDPHRAVEIAEEALKLAPASTWASHALLGFRCAQNDWSGALALLDSNLASGLLDKPSYRRQRAVLLTARALQIETSNRDLARESVMEAIKLAPTLIPAAALAARFESEAQQVRRAMKIIEAAWLEQPHPDLADAYAHVKLGDSARQRLTRVENLAAKTAGQIEGALAVARAAIDASEFAKARAALAPFVEAPTQRVAMLMAELERVEHGDSGKARAWTLRAVRAALDPAWTADGYVSDRWRPVSPVTGRLDAFQWQTPVAALPADRSPVIDTEATPETMFVTAQPAVRPAVLADDQSAGAVDAVVVGAPVPPPPVPAGAPAESAGVIPEAASAVVPAPADAAPKTLAATPRPAPPAEPLTTPPLFRTRADIAPGQAPKLPPIIPVVRPPDDPGVDDEGIRDEFAEMNGPQRQQGGWRGFLSRWAG